MLSGGLLGDTRLTNGAYEPRTRYMYLHAVPARSKGVEDIDVCVSSKCRLRGY